MNECSKKGCRRLEWKCKDCNRVVNTVEFIDFTNDNWISVKDQMPEDDIDILVYDSKKKEIFTVVYLIKTDLWIVNCDCQEQTFLDNATHWQPLPEPPKD